MKCLKRNMTKFWYFEYIGLGDDLDDDGLHTGIWQPMYEFPREYRGNISTPSGATIQGLQGIDVRYTHILVMDDPKLDIKETGYIFWNRNEYDITAVRPSLNSLTVALHQRTKDHGDQYEEPEGDG